MVEWQKSRTSGNRSASLHIMGTLISTSYSSPDSFTLPCSAVLQGNTIPRTLVNWLPGEAGRVGAAEDSRAEKRCSRGISLCMTHLESPPLRQWLCPAVAPFSIAPLLGSTSSHQAAPHCGSQLCKRPLFLGSGKHAASQL